MWQPIVRSDKWLQFGRFLLAGAFNTAASYLIFIFILLASGHPMISVILATALGVIISFATSSKFVFREVQIALLRRFTLLYVFLCALNLFIMKGLLLYTVWPAWFNQLVAVVILAPASFIFQRNLVFTAKQA